MSKLIWDAVAERDYESGLDRGVFYAQDGRGYAWNGLISVEESPSEGDARARYLDGKKIGNHARRGEFEATVQAYTYPLEAGAALAWRRPQPFGLSYRVHGPFGYKIHLVYNALMSPTAANYAYSDSATFSWNLTTRGLAISEGVFASHLVIDSTVAYPETMAALEEILYGSEDENPVLPTPIDVLQIFEDNSILQIIDHGDGTWTAIGPDDVITMLNPTTFQIDYETAVYLNATTYSIHSL